jgi:hypothetical protein
MDDNEFCSSKISLSPTRFSLMKRRELYMMSMVKRVFVMGLKLKASTISSTFLVWEVAEDSKTQGQRR